jgi:hypothetical protein
MCVLRPKYLGLSPLSETIEFELSQSWTQLSPIDSWWSHKGPQGPFLFF